MKCIFCEQELTPQTKPEHVLLSCLGGRKTTRRVDCSDHNETFGATIDNALAEQVRVIRNLLRLESGTGKPAPALRNIKAGTQTIHMDGQGGLTHARQKPFTIHKKPDGSATIEIKTGGVAIWRRSFRILQPLRKCPKRS